MKSHIRPVDLLVSASSDAPDTEMLARGVLTATLAGFAADGSVLVNLEVSGTPSMTDVTARSCVPLHANDVGKKVVIVRDGHDPDSPIVIGVIQSPATKPAVEITADGQRVEVQAEASITLKCGEASITLNRDGKVIIRGKHVVTHAAGVNRIRGGSIQLN